MDKYIGSKKLGPFLKPSKECNSLFGEIPAAAVACKLIVVAFVTTNHGQTLRKDGGYKSITVIKVFKNMNLAFYEHNITLFKAQKQRTSNPRKSEL